MFMYFLLVTGVGFEGNECRLLNSEIPCLMPSPVRVYRKLEYCAANKNLSHYPAKSAYISHRHNQLDIGPLFDILQVAFRVGLALISYRLL